MKLQVNCSQVSVSSVEPFKNVHPDCHLQDKGTLLSEKRIDTISQKDFQHVLHIIIKLLECRNESNREADESEFIPHANFPSQCSPSAESKIETSSRRLNMYLKSHKTV